MTTFFGKLGLKKRQNKKFIAGTAATAAGALLITGAILYPGFKTTEVDLNDGGVWVVSKTKNAVGRLNYPSRVLDGAVTPATTTFDVLQHDGNVFVDDESGSTINQVSAANLKLGGDKQLPSSSQVSYGSTVLSVTDPARGGKVWALSPSTVNGFDEEGTEPVLTGSPPGMVSAVGSDNRIYTADPGKGEIIVTTVDPNGGERTDSQVSKVDELKGAGDLQLAVVGDKPVVLDAASGNLFLPGGRKLQLQDAREAKLQQSSEDSSYVAIATRKALLKQPLDGPQPQP